MRILYVGDIVGSPGRRAFTVISDRLRGEHGLDAVVANAENSAAGRGPTPDIVDSLVEAGADLLTLGDHTWDQNTLPPYLDLQARIIRPGNFAASCPGRGLAVTDTPAGKLAVIQVIGRVFMPPHADCPFLTADRLLKQVPRDVPVVLAEIHCEATSEKIAFGRYLEGRVSAVVGTHTHVQTSDETILPGGTAYITDLGMTGPKDSVLGRDVQPVLHRFTTGMPAKFTVAENDVVLEGVVLDIDEATGKARKIQRVREPLMQA
jgi:metallophosphoesterase (TIGR00282 family)